MPDWQAWGIDGDRQVRFERYAHLTASSLARALPDPETAAEDIEADMFLKLFTVLANPPKTYPQDQPARDRYLCTAMYHAGCDSLSVLIRHEPVEFHDNS